MKKIIKQIGKILFTAVFCLILCCGCIFDPIINGGGGSGGSGQGEGVTACQLVEGDNKSTGSTTTEIGYKSNLSVTVTPLQEVMESTITIYACYKVNNQEYNMQSSGFIIDHDEDTNTYYITTSSSGIFYRGITKSTTSSSFDISTDTTVYRDANFEIVMENGSRYVAQLVGYSDNIDVAIFKFTTEDQYNVVTFGDSNTLNVGDSLYAIGTPVSAFALYNTVIRGEVSGLHRLSDIYFTETYNYTTYTGTTATMATFQFDASINGGMEGGPIVNANGEVVGISTYRYGVNSTDYSYESLAFGIAINDVRNVFNSILESGTYTKPLLGVTVTDLHNIYNSVTWLNTYKVYKGVYVSEIATGSAASAAGMTSDVVITQISDGTNTFEIENMACVYSALFSLASKNVTVTVVNSSGTSAVYSLALA